MESKSIHDYIWFGTCLRYLQDVLTGWPKAGGDYVLRNIDQFLDLLDECQLHVTKRAAWELVELRRTLEDDKSSDVLTADDAQKLQTIMRELRPTLLAEAQGKVAFIVTDKRLDVSKLLNDVRSLFAPGVFDVVPDTAKYDFIEAGKCIAFERPTAGAFHILRGTEAVLRHFYCCCVRRNRTAPLLWGPMVDSLRARRTRPPDVLLDNLDNIRRSFRNPTQHPEKIYDIQEVQDLVGLGVDVVNRMVGSSAWSAT